MGQQSNGIGLRYGVINGWDSSWSINSFDDIEYRDLVQVSSDVEKLVTNLFKLNQGYIGKVGISKNAQSNKIIINAFGYVPSKYKFVEDRTKNKGSPKSTLKSAKMISPSKHIRLKLFRLAEILSLKYKYLGVTFAVKCALANEYEVQPAFKRYKKRQNKNKQSFLFIHKGYQSIKFMGHDKESVRIMVPAIMGDKSIKHRDPVLYSQLVKALLFRKQSRKVPLKRKHVKLPRVLFRSRKKFGFLKRLIYYPTLINLAYWVFKTKQPQFLAKFLAQEFGKTRFQRSLYNNVDKVCSFLFRENSDIQGIRIQVSGRMNKSKRTRKFIVQYGAITTQTVTHPLKYAFEEAYTVYGSMGVKIWISY